MINRITKRSSPGVSSFSTTTDNLIAYYTMDDGSAATDVTIVDKSGNGHNLTCNNDPVAAGADLWTDEAGAISFDDGENTDYFVSSAHNDFQSTTTGRSVIIFMRTKVLAAGHDTTTGIFGMGEPSSGSTSGIDCYQLNTGLHRHRYKISGSAATNTGSVAALNDGAWHSYMLMANPGVLSYASVDGIITGVGYQALDISGTGADVQVDPQFWVAGQFNFGNPAEAMRIGRTEVYAVEGYVPNFRNLALWKHNHVDDLIPKALLP